MAELNAGDKAPDFTLETAEGALSLADFAGKTLVLYFYPKDDTPGCTKEAQAFTALAADFAKAGAKVVGVSKDTLAKHQKFTAKYDLGIALGSDPDAKTIEAFGVWIEKTLYGRKYMGIERATFVIRDGVIRQAWHGVKVPGHAEAVLAAVKGLSSGV